MIEIEKKWLIKKLPKLTDRFQKHDVLEIAQYYLSPTERIRSSYNMKTNETIYEHFFKEYVSKGSSVEEVKEITYNEYCNYLKTSADIKYISKVRHTYYDTHTGLKLEIDNFIDMQLMMLEIEFQSIVKSIEEVEKVFQMPQEIVPLIIFDATGVKEFSNYHLAHLYQK